MAPVLGAHQADAVIERINNLEEVGHVRELLSLLTRRV